MTSSHLFLVVLMAILATLSSTAFGELAVTESEEDASLKNLILSNLEESSEVGLARPDLGSAKKYAILCKAGVTNVPGSRVIGHLGVSPIAGTGITGFSHVMHATNVYSTSPQVVGKIYAANYAPPTPSYLTVAIGDMQRAYTNAAGRPSPKYRELGSGALGGRTLRPGLYKWSSSVSILSNVVISGGMNDVWIFQIAGNVQVAAGKKVILGNNAKAKNIFWQVAGKVTMGTTSHMAGIILCKTSVAMHTGSSLAGRIYAQTAVTLDHSTIVGPSW